MRRARAVHAAGTHSRVKLIRYLRHAECGMHAAPVRHRCGTVSTGPLSDRPLPGARVRPVCGAHACGQHQLWLLPVGSHLAVGSAVRWIRPVNDALRGVLVEDERDPTVDGAWAVGVAGPPRQSLIARCCPAGSTWLFNLRSGQRRTRRRRRLRPLVVLAGLMRYRLGGLGCCSQGSGAGPTAACALSPPRFPSSPGGLEWASRGGPALEWPVVPLLGGSS